MSYNRNLQAAKRDKNDDFYTQLPDIENELKHYRAHFRDRVVYCNCDDPRISNFFHYFSWNFQHLGLRKLITTCYRNRQRDLFSRHDCEQAIMLEYDGFRDQERVPRPEDIGITQLQGDGDFRSPECVAFLKQADIVVTNPPFSLFREYVAQLSKHQKKFIIIGSKNAITYKEIFPLIRDNRLWLGIHPGGRDMLFDVPPDHAAELVETKREGSAWRLVDGVVKGRLGNAAWYTNLSHGRRHAELYLSERYDPAVYPKYDNYDAIEVSSIAEIPVDFDGVMGVPITFLDRYNPDQFEIVGMGEDNGRNQSGNVWLGGSLKCLIDGKAKFKRLFIRNKNPGN